MVEESKDFDISDFLSNVMLTNDLGNVEGTNDEPPNIAKVVVVRMDDLGEK